MAGKLLALAKQGQSVWLDFIHRDFLAGELSHYIHQGLRGVTSNPTIFEKAIGQSPVYQEQILALTRQKKSSKEIYETLAIEDIQAAARLLRIVYDAEGGADGYVSLECAPDLAYDTRATLAEAERLYRAVGEPNVMIKIPGTAEGVPAIEEAIYRGIPINVTLLFGISAYQAVAEAYLRGLRRRAGEGKHLRVASVASFFLSRIDTEVDARLVRLMALTEDANSRSQLAALQGRAAIANAKLAYRTFQALFGSELFAPLAQAGAWVQRPLWASTSTKNPSYPDLHYVEPLIGSNTVNTMPPETLAAFLDHGQIARTVDSGHEEAEQVVTQLAHIGINLNEVVTKLEFEGVEKFAQSFTALLNRIEPKRPQPA